MELRPRGGHLWTPVLLDHGPRRLRARTLGGSVYVGAGIGEGRICGRKSTQCIIPFMEAKGAGVCRETCSARRSSCPYRTTQGIGRWTDPRAYCALAPTHHGPRPRAYATRTSPETWVGARIS
jgi:hypothetical protein